MIEIPYICILRGESEKEREQQKKRWRDLSASGLTVGQFVDISGKTPGEASEAILRAGQVYHLERAAVESLAGLADDLVEAVAIASALLASGARLFSVSYAVGGARLVEIDRRLMQTIVEHAGEFKPVRGDDLLFLAGYANRLVTLEDLLYHLTALEESLKALSGDVPPGLIAAEVRRIALLARVMQRQPYGQVSAN
jgi:hypothetical protein